MTTDLKLILILPVISFKGKQWLDLALEFCAYPITIIGIKFYPRMFYYNTTVMRNYRRVIDLPEPSDVQDKIKLLSTTSSEVSGDSEI